MKDFAKIFFAMCVLVGAFIFGRKYGEENYKQSEEYQTLIKIKEEQSFTKNDLENAKTKFQNILNGADSKKADELLGQVLQVLLADLGLRIENQKAFVKSEAELRTPSIPKEAPVVREKTYDYKRLKSYEWILKNSLDSDQIKKNLKNVEIKDIDSYLKGAKEAKPQDLESIYGSYRGRIMDVTQKEYATMAMEINPIPDSQPMKLKGSLKVFKNEKETTSKGFTTVQLGYQVEGSSGLIIDNGNTYFQVYKTTESQQIAGFYYERLVNGTTKTIGSFVLNRVDQF